MSAATSKADNLVLSNGKTSQQLIMGKANTFKAKAGEHYRILKHQEGVAEQLVDDLIAKRSGNDLQLHYADGTEVNLENYFTECDGASCDMTLPGDHGSEFKLSGDSATGAALGDGSHLVYVHGSHDVVLDMAQSNSALLSTLSGNNGAEITYIPPADHDAVAWAGGAALLLGGVALASGGGSNDAVPPPPPAPVHNIVTVSVVAGPVIETNGLTVNLYKADGTTLLGTGKLSATGTFTFDVGSYTGVVIAKVQDNDSGLSTADYIDEATGQARDLTANLMTVGVVNTGVVSLNINVLTTIAATKAGAVFDGVSAKPVTADVVVQTNTAVANAFGLADLTGSPVVTTVNTAGTANASFTPDSLSVAEKYGAVLAAFSGMDTTNGGNMQTAIDSVTAGLNVTGSTAVLNTTVLDSLVVGARAAAVNTNGTGDTSLSAVISDLTVKTSSSVSINRVATDDVVAINEPNSVISGTNAAGATVTLSIGGQNQTAVVTGTTWTYTLTASDITAMGQGGETIIATATLTTGETATATRSIVVDTVPPTIQISSNDAQLTAGETATLTFTLSDAAKDFAASDIVVTGGVLSNFTGSGKIYTATFTPTPGSSTPATINVAGSSFTSSSGNLNLPATELTLSVDTTVNAVPVITSGATASVAENTATSAVVYTATATDADAGTILSYSLSGTDAAAFNINSATGVVTLIAAANFETKSSYSFNVIASDGKASSTPQAVTLVVNNLDEVAPTITSGTTATAINENSGAGQVIYTATSTDVADTSTGATVYSLKAATGDVALLSINSSTGAVTLAGNPNFEVKGSYSFTVVATDAAGNASEKAVTLAINNLDEVAPSITSSAATAVNENIGAGQVIYTATSTDVADMATGATVYSLKAVTGDVALLSINSSTGAVTLAGNPDFETKASYSFTVIATDAAGNASEKAVTLAVNNLDEVAPSITSGATATAINENSGAGQVIYTATSIDVADTSTGATVYSLKAATGDVALLSINSSTGAVTLTGNPDFEVKGSYSFTVVATDAAGNASEKAVTLAINNLDEVAPGFTSSATATAMNENSGAGQVIYTATSTDVADIVTGATVYSLKAATGDVALLSINSSTGAVTLTGNPDFEVKGSYSFTVVATDAAGNASEKAVTLAVNNLDEVAPSITSGTTATAINENVGAGQVIYTATSTDVADIATGATVYSLKAATGDVALLSINSSTGAVTLTGNPDFETKANYSFTVVATDAAGNASEKAVTLAVNNLDEIAPSITSATTATAVNENSGAGQVIYTATSTDVADIATGSTVYSLKAATGDVALLSIDSSTGAVTLTGNPDFETKASYSFTVVATDAAGNASEQAVTLAINDLVDETPPQVGSVAVSSASGVQNSTLNAGDVVSVTVTMDEATVVNTTGGTPRIALNIGGTTVYASYASGSGTTALVFQYTIQAGQTDVNGISIDANSLSANGGTLRDVAGNAATLTHIAAADNAGFLVDTTAPTANFTSATDDVGSVTGTLISGARTDDTSLVLAGTCEAGSTVNVYNGATLLGAATVSGTSWSYSAAVVNGTTYQFNVKESDPAGNTSAATSYFTVIGDTLAPTANLTSATDDVGSVTGALISGARTDDTSLALAGTCEAGATVNIYDGATLLGAATVSGTSWSYNAAITDGTTYQFNAKETDIAGNTSAATSNFTVIGDTTPPTANFTSATDDIGTVTGTLISGARTDDTSLVLAGTCEAGSTVNIYNGVTLLGAATVSGTSWSWNAAITDGITYQFNAKETDSAGNTSTATSNFTVIGDTTAPTAHFTSATDDAGSLTGTLISGGRTDDTSLVLAGTCEAGSTVNVYNGVTLLGAATVSGTSWSYTATLANGATYQFNEKETDAAGNTSAATSNFVVTGDTSVTAHLNSVTDNVGSIMGPLVSGSRSDDTSLVLAGTCEAGSVVYIYDGASLIGAGTVSGTNWTYTASIADGTSYLFNVSETDTSGNNSVQTSNFAVTGDTSAPTLTSSTPADNATAVAVNSNIVLTFNENVLAGSGNIVISDGGADVRTISITDSSQVSISGGVVTINPTADLAGGTHYDVTMSSGVITDTAGNNFSGIAQNARDFDTVAGDTSAPLLTSSSPLDNATGVAVSSNIVLTFNENVQAGSGNIVISNGGADVHTISITDSSQVTISGGVVTINPAADLVGSTHYDVTMSAGVITDTAGNSFTGIAQNARDFDTAAVVLDSSIVVFDLVQGVTSAHSSRTFAAGVDYTIYIRVDSGGGELKHGGAHGDTWGQWSGANNLDANDKVILVGSGSAIGVGGGQFVGARGHGAGAAGGAGTMQWGVLASPLAPWAANLTSVGLFMRHFNGNPVVGATTSNGIYLWSGEWSNATKGFPGKATGALWLNALPVNVLTSQGLAS